MENNLPELKTNILFLKKGKGNGPVAKIEVFEEHRVGFYFNVWKSKKTEGQFNVTTANSKKNPTDGKYYDDFRFRNDEIKNHYHNVVLNGYKKAVEEEIKKATA